MVKLFIYIRTTSTLLSLSYGKLICTSTLGLLTSWLICPHNVLESHLKLDPGFQACFIIISFYIAHFIKPYRDPVHL